MRSTFAIFAAVIAVVTIARAEEFPSKPIKLVVPYSAGGGTDVVARLVGQKLSDQLGQPIVVENRSGAGGRIGTESVVRSPADGYTLLFNNETLVVAPSISKDLPYDAANDLTPIGMVGGSAIVVGVHPDVQAKTLPELIAMAKANPGKLSYSSCGNGTVMHFAGEQLKLAAGISMTHVPYRGCAPAIQDAASGQVPIFINVLTNAGNLDKAGRVRVLAVATSGRFGLAPNVQTVAEQGFPNFEANTFQALYGPPGMPANIANRLSAALREVVMSPDFIQRMRAMMMEPALLSPKELGNLLRSDTERW